MRAASAGGEIEMDGLDDGLADELGHQDGFLLFYLFQHLGLPLEGVAVGDHDVGTAVFQFGDFLGGGLGTLTQTAGGAACGGHGRMTGLVATHIEGVGAVVEVVARQQLVGRGVVQDELGAHGVDLAGTLGGAYLDGGLLRGEAH